MKEPDIINRTFNFGVRIVKMASFLPKTPVGFALASQMVRAGTSIGANIEESQGAHSKKDFIHGMQISLKEGKESLYWLKVLNESGLVDKVELSYLLQECEEIVRILVAIVKNSKNNF